MKRFFSICCLLATAFLTANADGFDQLKEALENNAQVQEKVYVHTDNTCYFVGDTLWYKAYVLRADDLRPTDMSRVLYVELLSPDGLVVERQRIIVANQGHTCGQFVLKDSLYSGYYELRAYTRWMLNFNVSHRHYSREDRHLFYNNQMAADFFREWDGLFSRVLPIYSKPEQQGDFAGKYMYARPKQDVRREPKEELICRFYPEGGQLVEKQPSRVAFELTDQYGKAVDLEGKLSDGTTLKTDYMGRGIFQLESGKADLKARFSWRGKEYLFNLPKVEKQGVSLALKNESNGKNIAVSLFASPEFQGKTVGVAVLCRGRLVHFEKQSLATSTTHHLTPNTLPTGINELLIFDENRNVLASRLFFVNNGDVAVPMQVSTGGKTDFEPYEAIPLEVQASLANPTSFSVAVRDAHTDDPSYDDGNMLTELLLASDLKGFVPYPAYYFERDDAERRSRLDLLMMVQGWRRYRPVKTLRYKPEQTLTVEGAVYPMLDVQGMERDQVEGLNSHTSVIAEQQQTNNANSGLGTGGTFTETNDDNAQADDAEAKATSVVEEPDFASFSTTTVSGANHGGLKHEVLVEAELTGGGQTAGAVQLTKNGGAFVFELPPYYGHAILFMKAYEQKDSVKKSMERGFDKQRLNEDQYADFYVKRDLFYPVFAREYSWYEKHQPDYVATNVSVEEEVDLNGSRLDGDHTLSQVNVSARRRGRRAVDYTKPAHVVDAYDLYNDATDRGLSWGLVNMGSFPRTACFTLYGNMGRYVKYNVRARIADGHQLDRAYTFYQDYQSTNETVKNRSEAAIFKDLHLNRLQNFRFYTDFEPRNPDTLYTESVNREDITVVYETIPNDGKQYTYRDRRYLLPGFAEPEEFYSPDYGHTVPPEPTDYRRTLYWNPNARPDDDGKFRKTIYNNSRETRIRVSVAGITNDGKIVVKDQ